MINIDGQAAIWKVDGFKDSKPLYDKDGKASRDPEAGEGMKYALERKISLPEGIYNLFFGLPEDDYYANIKLSLKQGDEYLLEFGPIYRKKTLPTRIPTFVKGMSRYDVFLNGKLLKISAD